MKQTLRHSFLVVLALLIVLPTVACRFLSVQSRVDEFVFIIQLRDCDLCRFLSVQSRVVEVAEGKPTTASSFYRGGENYSFLPSGIVDRRTNELSCTIGVEQGNTYWLLADHRTGWVQVDLQETLPIVKLRWLNTHNGDCADRATTKYHIALSPTGDFLGEETVVQSGEIEFTTSVEHQEVILSSPVIARYVRFYVDEYYNWGGGLNELEVYANVSHP